MFQQQLYIYNPKIKLTLFLFNMIELFHLFYRLSILYLTRYIYKLNFIIYRLFSYIYFYLIHIKITKYTTINLFISHIS